MGELGFMKPSERALAKAREVLPCHNEGEHDLDDLVAARRDGACCSNCDVVTAVALALDEARREALEERDQLGRDMYDQGYKMALEEAARECETWGSGESLRQNTIAARIRALGKEK